MRSRFVFFGIVSAYLWLACLYAVNTPRWQVPDEPAHYNYIRFIAERASLPVLQAGDYDHAYLEKIKAQKFPPDMSIDGIRYEFHQPPIYYVLNAPLYKIGEGASLEARLMSLRLFSALWGVVLLALVYRLAKQIFPVHKIMPLIAAALAAFVPQHLAIASGVNNDLLAEVVLAGAALGLVKIQEGKTGRNRTWEWVGLLVGLGLLIKTTTYVSVGLVVLAAGLLWLAQRSASSTVQSADYVMPAVRALLVAFLIGSSWFARNALTYGPTDWLGLQRHNAVVTGQPRTLELYPNYLMAAADWFPITFRSFWGQFGWMGVVLDRRVYDALLAFTLFALAGLSLYVVPAVRRFMPPSHPRLLATRNGSGHDAQTVRAQLIVLSAWFVGTLAATAAYSLEFFQAQGRYLFPALGALAIFMALGLRGWIRLGAVGAMRFGSRLPTVEWVLVGWLIVGLILLDFICLYRFLIPALR